MNTLTIRDDLLDIIHIFKGITIEECIENLIRETIYSKLQNCNYEISLLENKYGMEFNEFSSLWDNNKISNKFSYEVESDYIKWEALEMEKKRWLSILRKINNSK